MEKETLTEILFNQDTYYENGITNKVLESFLEKMHYQRICHTPVSLGYHVQADYASKQEEITATADILKKKDSSIEALLKKEKKSSAPCLEQLTLTLGEKQQLKWKQVEWQEQEEMYRFSFLEAESRDDLHYNRYYYSSFVYSKNQLGKLAQEQDLSYLLENMDAILNAHPHPLKEELLYLTEEKEQQLVYSSGDFLSSMAIEKMTPMNREALSKALQKKKSYQNR